MGRVSCSATVFVVVVWVAGGCSDEGAVSDQPRVFQSPGGEVTVTAAAGTSMPAGGVGVKVVNESALPAALRKALADAKITVARVAELSPPGAKFDPPLSIETTLPAPAKTSAEEWRGWAVLLVDRAGNFEAVDRADDLKMEELAGGKRKVTARVSHFSWMIWTHYDLYSSRAEGARVRIVDPLKPVTRAIGQSAWVSVNFKFSAEVRTVDLVVRQDPRCFDIGWEQYLKLYVPNNKKRGNRYASDSWECKREARDCGATVNGRLWVTPRGFKKLMMFLLDGKKTHPLAHCIKCPAGDASCSGTCANGVKDAANGETDTDCGGKCSACPSKAACKQKSDCAAGHDCTPLFNPFIPVPDGVITICVPVTCADGTCNGGETDKDCGGETLCQRCAEGLGCETCTDCQPQSSAKLPGELDCSLDQLTDCVVLASTGAKGKCQKKVKASDGGTKDAGPTDAGPDGPKPEAGIAPDAGPDSGGPGVADAASAGDGSASTGGCTAGMTEAKYTGWNKMVECSTKTGTALTQCASTKRCATGWHLCTATEYLARGGKVSGGKGFAGMAGCVRNGLPFTTWPLDGVCGSCAGTHGSNVVSSWYCAGGGGAIPRSDLYLAIWTATTCHRVGLNLPSHGGYWTTIGASQKFGRILCCSK